VNKQFDTITKKSKRPQRRDAIKTTYVSFTVAPKLANYFYETNLKKEEK
jgi:hypothetical protein